MISHPGPKSGSTIPEGKTFTGQQSINALDVDDGSAICKN
jgi:hypothetical protein